MKDTKVDINDRRQMPPYAGMFRNEIQAFLRSPQVGPLFKARLWRVLPLQQRQELFDRSVPYFEKLSASQEPRWDVARAFPMPPGMEAYREREPAGDDRDRRNAEQGERHNR